MSGPADGSPEGDASSSGLGPRRAARLAAVQALYQIEFAHNEPEGTILEFLHHRHGTHYGRRGDAGDGPGLFL